MSAKPILETSGTMLIYTNKDNHHLLLESNKRIFTENIINSIIKSITTVIIIIALIIIVPIFITIIACICYYHRPEIQLKYTQAIQRLGWKKTDKNKIKEENKKDEEELLFKLLKINHPSSPLVHISNKLNDANNMLENNKLNNGTTSHKDQISSEFTNNDQQTLPLGIQQIIKWP